MSRLFGRVVLALCAIVFIKLFYLQVITASELTQSAEERRSHPIVLHAKRGTIYDRNGNVLAMSKDCKTVCCNPQEINDPSGAAAVVADALGGKSQDYLEKMRGDGVFAYVARQIEPSDASEIEGVYLVDDTKRIYPYGAVASQVLGIVGTDGDGLSGLELYYNDILKGEDGEMLLETGAGGTPIAGGNSHISDAKDGADIVLSIDVDIQRVAEETIAEGVKRYKSDSGSVVVTKPKTGEILAACSTPLFNISDTTKIESGALSLKPVSSSYEPGSIFKVLSAAIALESGAAKPEDVFTVPANVQVGEDMVSDDDGRTETMDMDLREILRRSSNAGISLVTQEHVGETRFAKGVSSFGIGSVTGIDYPGEVEGLVKQLNQYDGASLGSMSFGQSLAIPLIQMVEAVGSIANDGSRMTPHFLVSKNGEAMSWDSVGTSVSKETADEVTDMMREVVRSGTATAAQVEGYDIAGKTGTGEQADESGYIQNHFVSSLIGFAPASDPEVLVYVGLNGTPYFASTSAAALFSTIMGEALSDSGVQPSS